MNERIWIYLSAKAIQPEQEKIINETLTKFFSGWNAHGDPLASSYEILHHHFLIVRVNESLHSASGCSIDKLTHCIQQLEKLTGLSFFNRHLIAFMKENALQVYPSSQTSQLLESGIINEDTKVFNLSVSTRLDLETSFEISLKESWLKKYLVVKQ
jgi:23S rRNA-/tRNA-specific pseudouridylate synthase